MKGPEEGHGCCCKVQLQFCSGGKKMCGLYLVVLLASVVVPVNLQVVTYQGRKCAVPGTELEQCIVVQGGRKVVLGDCWLIP